MTEVSEPLDYEKQIIELGFTPASIQERVKAVLLDSVVLFIFFAIVSYTLNYFKLNDPTYKVFFVVLIGFYDPITISFFGGTIGQLMSNLRTKQLKNIDKNIPIYLAIIRFVFKFALGWISLISLGLTKQSRAIHDYASGSIVIRKEL